VPCLTPTLIAPRPLDKLRTGKGEEIDLFPHACPELVEGMGEGLGPKAKPSRCGIGTKSETGVS